MLLCKCHGITQKLVGHPLGECETGMYIEYFIKAKGGLCTGMYSDVYKI